MKQLLILSLALLTMSSINIAHESVSASFNIIKKGHVLLLEIEFDDENFIKFGETENLKVTKKDFQKYLNQTTSWEIDGIILTPQILSVKSIREHTKVICYLSKAKENIKSVRVKNEFLIDVKDHSNIIKLDINNTFKDFRMHKKRIELEVIY